ncbi:MAG: dihydropteroate synthase [Culicoidibacterales bacterium]
MFQSNTVQLIGILNVSPDSFSDGKEKTVKDAINQAKQLIADGATIIDIGAESTRPDADLISIDMELARLEAIVSELVKEDVLISVDTYKKEVAQKMLELGVDIINDVSGLLYDTDKIEAIKAKEASIIIMHNRLNQHGLPHATKQPKPYTDVVEEVIQELQVQVDIAKNAGLKSSQIAIDPGFGFAKTYEDNIMLFKGLDRIRKAFLPHAIVIGTSNKSFIGHMTGNDVDKRIAGTLATSMYSVTQDCCYLRVHDVKAHSDFFHVYTTIGGK